MRKEEIFSEAMKNLSPLYRVAKAVAEEVLAKGPPAKPGDKRRRGDGYTYEKQPDGSWVWVTDPNQGTGDGPDGPGDGASDARQVASNIVDEDRRLIDDKMQQRFSQKLVDASDEELEVQLQVAVDGYMEGDNTRYNVNAMAAIMDEMESRRVGAHGGFSQEELANAAKRR